MVTGLYVTNTYRKCGDFESGGQKIAYDNTQLYCQYFDPEKGLVPKTYTCKTNECVKIGFDDFNDLHGHEVMLQTEAKSTNGTVREIVQSIMVIPDSMGGGMIEIVFHK